MRKYGSHTPPHGATEGSTFDMQALRKISEGEGGEGELAEVLHDALLEGNKYERKVAEGASVMLRRKQKPRKIAEAIIQGEVKSPRLYDRRLSEVANVWTGDPYSGADYESTNPMSLKRYKPKGVEPTNLPDWIKDGDILIGRIGGSVRRYTPGMEMHRNEIIIGIKPGAENDFDIDALRYYLQSKIDSPELRLRGSVKPAIRVKDVRRIDLKDSPIEKQRNWANTIETVDKLIDVSEEQIEKAKMMREGLLRDRQRRPFNKIVPVKNREYLEKLTKKQIMEQIVIPNQITYPNRGPMANKPIDPKTMKNKKWLIDRIIEYDQEVTKGVPFWMRSPSYFDQLAFDVIPGITDDGEQRIESFGAQGDSEIISVLDWKSIENLVNAGLLRQSKDWRDTTSDSRQKYVQDWAEENRKMIRDISDEGDNWEYDDSEKTFKTKSLSMRFEELFKDEQALLAWELKELYGIKNVPTEVINTDNNRPYILTGWEPESFRSLAARQEDNERGLDRYYGLSLDNQYLDNAVLEYQLADAKSLDSLRSESDPVFTIDSDKVIKEFDMNKEGGLNWLDVKRFNRRISDGKWRIASREMDTMALPPLLSRNYNGKQYTNFGDGFTSKSEANNVASKLRSKINRQTGKPFVNVRVIKGSINGRPVWRNYVAWR